MRRDRAGDRRRARHERDHAPDRQEQDAVWHWQERFASDGVGGLLLDKTRSSRIAPFGPEVGEKIIALTLAEPPGETTQWTGRAMAKAAGAPTHLMP